MGNRIKKKLEKNIFFCKHDDHIFISYIAIVDHMMDHLEIITQVRNLRQWNPLNVMKISNKNLRNCINTL